MISLEKLNAILKSDGYKVSDIETLNYRKIVKASRKMHKFPYNCKSVDHLKCNNNHYNLYYTIHSKSDFAVHPVFIDKLGAGIYNYVYFTKSGIRVIFTHHSIKQLESRKCKIDIFDPFRAVLDELDFKFHMIGADDENNVNKISLFGRTGLFVGERLDPQTYLVKTFINGHISQKKLNNLVDILESDKTKFLRF